MQLHHQAALVSALCMYCHRYMMCWMCWQDAAAPLQDCCKAELEANVQWMHDLHCQCTGRAAQHHNTALDQLLQSLTNKALWNFLAGSSSSSTIVH